MKFTSVILPVLVLMIHSSCIKTQNDSKEKSEQQHTIQIEKEDILTTAPLTKEQQQQLKPEDVVNRLIQGNTDFTKDNLTIRNTTERVRRAALAQYPKAIILSCLDSRVPVEDIFHSGIGNLFVARVAGNIVNEDILGSMEYACKVSGAKVIFVLGHEYCGAVKSAIDGVKMGNITGLLTKINPAVTNSKAIFEGPKTSSNPAFVEAVCDENVKLAINQIHEKSQILRKMESKRQIMIVGGVYDMKTGRVQILK
jgi:carbonic anhydrase